MSKSPPKKQRSDESAHSSTSITMGLYQDMHTFNSVISKYLQCPDEKIESAIASSLKKISECQDVSIFNPNTIIANQFYLNLYNFINDISDIKSNLLWISIDILHKAIKNSVTKNNLINDYKFSFVLSKILGPELTYNQHVKLLNVLQELTYGINISWQPTHLPKFMSTLVDSITKSKEIDIINLSLSILVNLCFRNLSTLQILTQIINIKEFFSKLLKLKMKNKNTQVQCCKMFIIMEKLDKEVSEDFILSFIDISFENIIPALQNEDILILRNIFDFFDDIILNEHSKNILRSFKNHDEEVNLILNELQKSKNPECFNLTIKFFMSLMELKNQSLTSSYGIAVKIIMKWIKNNYSSPQALSCLKKIIMTSKQTSVFAELITLIDVPLLLSIIKCDLTKHHELIATFSEILQLLFELIKITEIRKQIFELISEDIIRNIFNFILNDYNVVNIDSNATGNNLIESGLFKNTSETSIIGMYIHTLSLTAELSSKNYTWLTLHSDLIKEPKILEIIALAIYLGNPDEKLKALNLLSTDEFSQERKSTLANYMHELGSELLIKNKVQNTQKISANSVYNNYDSYPIVSLHKIEQLNNTIEKFENALKENKTSEAIEVQELYEYKIAMFKQSEITLRKSLEAGEYRIINLQHTNDQLSLELDKMRQMLYHNNQNIRTLQSDKTKLNEKFETVYKENFDLKKNTQELLKDLKNLREDFNKKDRENTASQQQCQKYVHTISEYEANIKKMKDELSELTKMRDMIFSITAKKNSTHENG